MLRRFFQRLQHRVEGMVGQHVHFIDHVDLEARIRRCIDRLFQQLRHFVDAAVRRRIHLDIVDETSGIDRHARLADTARRCGDAAVAVGPDAIQRFRQDPRQSSLANTAGTGEQIGVVQTLLLQGVRQGPNDVFLADQRIETSGAIFTGENLVGHRRRIWAAGCEIQTAFYLTDEVNTVFKLGG